MKVGVCLQMVDAGSMRTATIADLADQAERAEALGFDSVWAMDHYWSQTPRGRAGGHEPMLALAYLAARTRRIDLGILVLCNSFRDPGQLAREAAALADASQGRLILGLGAGWNRPEYDAFGIPFDYKTSRLEEALMALAPLLRGEHYSHQGRFYKFSDATVLTTVPPPPIWVAAFGERMLELTARHAAGWNTAWGGAGPAWFAERLAGMRELERRVGRPGERLIASAAVFCLPLEGAELESAAERVATLRPGTTPEEVKKSVMSGGPARIAESIAAYREAGCDHLIISLSPAPFSRLDPGYLEMLAPALKLAN